MAGLSSCSNHCVSLLSIPFNYDRTGDAAFAPLLLVRLDHASCLRRSRRDGELRILHHSARPSLAQHRELSQRAAIMIGNHPRPQPTACPRHRITNVYACGGNEPTEDMGQCPASQRYEAIEAQIAQLQQQLAMMRACDGNGTRVTRDFPFNCNHRPGATCVSQRCLAGVPVDLDRLSVGSYQGGGHGGSFGNYGTGYHGGMYGYGGLQGGQGFGGYGH